MFIALVSQTSACFEIGNGNGISFSSKNDESAKTEKPNPGLGIA